MIPPRLADAEPPERSLLAARKIMLAFYRRGVWRLQIESVPMLPASTSTARLPHLFIC
jgi:hypothetical protein